MAPASGTPCCALERRWSHTSDIASRSALPSLAPCSNRNRTASSSLQYAAWSSAVMWHLRSGPPRGPPLSPTVTRTTCSRSAPPASNSRTTATDPAPAATISGEYGDCASSLLALGSAPAAIKERTTPTTGLPSSSSGGSVTAQHSGGSMPAPGGPLGSAPRWRRSLTAGSSPASAATPRGVSIRWSPRTRGRDAADSRMAPPSRRASMAAHEPLPAACARGGMPPLMRSGSAPALISEVTVSASSSLAAAARGVRCRSPP